MKINFNQLRRRCLSRFEDFEGELRVGPNGRHLFIDNGGDVLAVAHLDTVQSSRHFIVDTIGSEKIVLNCQLDDRLGAYIILDHLPKLGLKYDVLLTEGEESGRSTAADFVPAKDYNWMFSFDRNGTDVVMYQYEDEPIIEVIEQEYGVAVGIGSFSDICFLGHLGIKGFNWGCGYHDNHGRFSHAVVEETAYMMEAFQFFFANYQSVKLPHVEDYSYPQRFGISDYEWNYPVKADSYRCDECGVVVPPDRFWFDLGICTDCQREFAKDQEYGRLFERELL